MSDRLRTRIALLRHRCWCCGISAKEDGQRSVMMSRLANGYRSCGTCKYSHCARGARCRGK